MAGVITTGSFPKELMPGVRKWFGIGYGEHAEEYKDLFEMNPSSKNFEEDVMSTGPGLMAVKNQGGAITYDSVRQGWIKRYVHLAYALGFIMTYEQKKDGQYPELSRAKAKQLGFSKRQTKETIAANVYNRAHTSGYTGGDGSVLCVTSHTSAVGSQANCLSTAADLSEVALEDMLTIVHKMTDDAGMKIGLQPQALIVPPDLWFDANRILKSALQSESANNATNALRVTNALPGGVKMNHYLTDADSCFVRTNVMNGMLGFDRDNIDIMEDMDRSSTMNQFMFTYWRGDFGWTDWRGVVSNAGGS